MNWNYKVLTPKEYLKSFPIKAEEVPPVVGQPTFVASNVVITALKTNSIAMDDDRSALGELHCMMDSSSMEANKTKILASKDPGELIYDGLATEANCTQHLASYSQKKAFWESVKYLKEACKRFMLSRFESVYFQELSDSLTKFKTVDIIQLIDHITTAFPPEPEEISAVEATLREPWDPTNHIEDLFQAVKEGTETLLLMKYVTSKTDCEKLFIKYAYAAIQNSGQFEKDCIKWKTLPDKDKKTSKQCRTFFGKSYNIYNTSQNSLALAGVANSVQQVQELEQATRNGFISISERQEEQDAVNARQDAINASVLQMVAARSTDGVDDNTTAFSAMTVSSAVKDRRIEELEIQLRRANSNSNSNSNSNTAPPPTDNTSGGSSFPWRGGGGRGSSGGRGGGRGRGNYRSRADGPANMTKNSKYWKADTYCWTCGYDCSRNHGSKTCEHKTTGHQDAATGANPMGGSTKDKEYSKWK
jgi:hypothetical protein